LQWPFCSASKSVSGDGRTFALANQTFIFGHGVWNVCDGAHWLEVMNEWEVLNNEDPTAGA
jgi:hypothetical protein